MPEPLLGTEEVTVRFGGVTALDGASLQVEPGLVTGLIGPNGAGKTTLFDAVCGFTVPERGRIRFDGADVTTWPPERRAAAGIGRTFQRLELFGGMTVLENCVVAYEARSSALTVFDDVVGLPRGRRAERDARAHAEAVLATVGLEWARDRLAGELPLGLGRVLELARALSAAPRVLLLDEPSSGLDPAETASLGELVARVTAERGLGVLLVEHDVGLVARICDRVFVMDAGRVIAEGTPDEVRSDERVIAAYLGASA